MYATWYENLQKSNNTQSKRKLNVGRTLSHTHVEFNSNKMCVRIVDEGIKITTQLTLNDTVY